MGWESRAVGRQQAGAEGRTGEEERLIQGRLSGREDGEKRMGSGCMRELKSTGLGEWRRGRGNKRGEGRLFSF